MACATCCRLACRLPGSLCNCTRVMGSSMCMLIPVLPVDADAKQVAAVVKIFVLRVADPVPLHPEAEIGPAVEAITQAGFGINHVVGITGGWQVEFALAKQLQGFGKNKAPVVQQQAA